MSPNSPKLLGREIMYWIGVVNALIAAVLSLKLVDWSPEQTSWVLAAVNAVFAVLASIAVRPFPVPLLSAGLVAILTMAAGFGLPITNEQVGVWNTLLVAVWAAITQMQVTPEPGIDPAVSSPTR